MPTLGPVSERIVVPFDGHRIGQGFNTDSGERVGTGLTAGQVGEDPNTDGQLAHFFFDTVTSQQALEESLNINAEVEASFLLLGGGMKFDFAEKHAVNSSSTYIIAS